MKTTLILAAAGAAIAAPVAQQASAYSQCGGQNWSGPTTCVSGWTCQVQNAYYSQCVQGSGSAAASQASSTVQIKASSSAIVVKPSSSAVAIKPSSSAVPAKSSSSAAVVVQQASTSIKSTPSSTSKAATATSAAASSSSGKVKYGGINISGFDFGCGTDGTCTTSGVVNPGTTGINQMNHFVKDDGLNAFRLPVGWQYLVNNNLGGTLDSTNFANYDALVQGCLNSGAALCIIDVHNYARWNGQIIGQGGPTNDQFTSLWTQIAKKYANNAKVAFGIMNEPHDVDITTWAATVQAAVTAIRQAGATSNIILLPGNNYTGAATYISNGSAAALLKVTNADGTTTNLIFDVHAYLDSDNSGTHADCTTNNIDNAFSPLATWLRSNKRMAFLSETGGGPNASTCETDLCQELAYLNSNSDVFLGFTTWAAGMFDTSYVLSETPTLSGSTYTDQTLVTKCIVANFK